MKVVLGSLFRNVVGHQLDRYLVQAKGLREILKHDDHTLSLIGVEGDSEDDSYFQIVKGCAEADLPMVLRRFNHGKPDYGSTPNPERLAALGQCGNALLDIFPDDADVLLFVESDLIWEPIVLLGLAEYAFEEQAILAPLVVFHAGWFYDTWAFRRNGVAFKYFPPYHPDVANKEMNELLELDTAGSCLAIPSKIARVVRYSDEAILGIARSARAAGYHTYLVHGLSVYHPNPLVVFDEDRPERKKGLECA